MDCKQRRYVLASSGFFSTKWLRIRDFVIYFHELFKTKDNIKTILLISREIEPLVHANRYYLCEVDKNYSITPRN